MGTDLELLRKRVRAWRSVGFKLTWKASVVIRKDTTRSLARMLAARHCRREKCCVQLFECWLPISETGSEVANCIYHRHSIATYARYARALYSAARHGS